MWDKQILKNTEQRVQKLTHTYMENWYIVKGTLHISEERMGFWVTGAWTTAMYIENMNLVLSQYNKKNYLS